MPEGRVRLEPGEVRAGPRSLSCDEPLAGWGPESALVRAGEVLSRCESGAGARGLAFPGVRDQTGFEGGAPVGVTRSCLPHSGPHRVGHTLCPGANLGVSEGLAQW